jgi:thiol-disulfide isomerase/thioredoxin
MPTKRFLALVLAFVLCANAQATDRILDPKEPLGAALVDFLQTRNTSNLIKQAVVSPADLEAEAQRFGRTLGAHNSGTLQSEIASTARNFERTGADLLKLGNRLGIVSPKARWTVAEILVSRVDKTTNPRVHRADESMEFGSALRVTLRRDEDAPARAELNGDYLIELELPTKFPTGWRAYNGIRWLKFPPGVVDREWEEDLAMASRLRRHTPKLLASEDPALRAFGDRAAHFLRSRDITVYENELIASIDLIFKIAQVRAPQEELPPREEMEKFFARYKEKLVASARAALADADRLGLDFSKATVKDVFAERVYPRFSDSNLQGFGAGGILVTLALPEWTNSAGKVVPSGDYVLAGDSAERKLGRWYVDEVRWASLPEGLLSKEELARLQFENYVAKHGTLPPGTPAPDIEIISVEDETRRKLSDFRGKVVVLEWWATWCGPCQEPMAKLQQIPAAHPNWRDKVEILTVSIDDDLTTVRKHLNEKGWTRVKSFWSGGGWDSAPAKAFRVSGVPTFYIVGPDGKVAHNDHHAGSSWADIVDSLLKISK